MTNNQQPLTRMVLSHDMYSQLFGLKIDHETAATVTVYAL